MKRAPTTVDAYLAGLPRDQCQVLEKLRATIRKIVPHAEECISYRIPAFRFEGTVIAGFCARKSGCSYFPFSGKTLATLAEDVKGFGGTKSALHFQRPLPSALVRKLLKARIAEAQRQTS